MKKISIVTPTFNEEANIVDICESVCLVLSNHPAYEYEHIFIDNCSTDQTVAIIKGIAAKNPKVKLIVNARNFGQNRSPLHAFFLGDGDAISIVAADGQDPPELLSKFIAEWEKGYKIVVAIRESRDDSWLFGLIRKFYYRLLGWMSDLELIKDYHGYGLYDRIVVEALRRLKDPTPYFRGMVCEVGFPRCEISYHMPSRQKGFSKNNLYSLYDQAMLGLVSYSKVPLRLAIFVGFGMAMISFALAFVYLIYKLLYWDQFRLGMAPLVIGFFGLCSIQLIFMGIIGEYIASIQTYVKDRPLVFEKERANFDRSIQEADRKILPTLPHQQSA